MNKIVEDVVSKGKQNERMEKSFRAKPYENLEQKYSANVSATPEAVNEDSKR